MLDKKKIFIITLIILLGIVFVYLVWPKQVKISQRKIISITKLPEPKLTGNMPVEEAIQNRRSVRKYTNQSLTLQEVSQLLWAAQGITDPETKFRAAPSAGHTYPLEIYLIVGTGTVQGLDNGVYHYNPLNNSLEKIVNMDIRQNLSKAAHNQPEVEKAPADIVITGVYQRMIVKYEDEKLSTRFVDMEAGHAGENIYLQTTAMNLSTVALGSFYDDQVEKLLLLPANEKTLYIYPVGHSGS